MSEVTHVPAKQGQAQNAVGVGVEAITIQYQDRDRTVTVERKRYGLWGLWKWPEIKVVSGLKAAATLIFELLFRFKA